LVHDGQRVPSPDEETGFLTGWQQFVKIEVIDARARRAVPELSLDTLYRVGVAFDEDLNRSIGMIPHPAGDAFAQGRRLDKISKTHTLHPATDDVSARDEHRLESRRYHTAPVDTLELEKRH
jgi:hypothetical protein